MSYKMYVFNHGKTRCKKAFFTESRNASAKGHARGGRAIRLLKQGRKQVEVADILGVRAATLSDWNRLYKAGGKKALTLQSPGPSKGSHCFISPDQEKEIQRLIIDKTPDQLKLPFVLWDHKAVKELIYRQYSIQ
ncbi:helix-turn-helix domain-containing protein [Caldithrix abyssi]|nr:helix-turn-helix domain-containing protein [Caldithrix abyssi]